MNREQIKLCHGIPRRPLGETTLGKLPSFQPLIQSFLRQGTTRNLYFPLINHESRTSNQIQLANIYDIYGNSLLLNEIVLNDRIYIFEHVSSSIHLLTEKTIMLPSVQMTTECTQKCPAGQSGPPNFYSKWMQVDGPGLDEKLEWCELEKVQVLGKKTLVSTYKRILVIPKPFSTKL